MALGGEKKKFKKSPIIKESDIEEERVQYETFKKVNVQKLLYNLKQATIMEVEKRSLINCIKLSETGNSSLKLVELDASEMYDKVKEGKHRVTFDMIVGPICVLSRNWEINKELDALDEAFAHFCKINFLKTIMIEQMQEFLDSTLSFFMAIFYHIDQSLVLARIENCIAFFLYGTN